MFIVHLMIMFYLMAFGRGEAFNYGWNWSESIPQVQAHDFLITHPHLRDLKMAAKRGKILVITLVASAGLVALVSAAILKGGKEEKEADSKQNIDPAELRPCVIAAVVAGRRGLAESREQALGMALTAYAQERGVQWKGQALEYLESATYNVGGDSLTVAIPDDCATVEVQSIRGDIGVSATANAEDDSIRSSVFLSHGLKREVNIG